MAKVTGHDPEYCKRHDGGRRCRQADCVKGAIYGFDHCKRHGGGRRCKKADCVKGAIYGFDHCTKHGGGRRCMHGDCAKGAIHGFDYCKRHGGGRRCMHGDCAKGAIHGFDYCKRHGGGRRCMHGDCAKGAIHGFDYCKRHGGGRRCKHGDCAKGAIHGFDYCKRHGGGRRCKQADCSTSAVTGFDYCTRHGGGHRCQTEACSIYDVRPAAYYRSGSLRVCWGCFAVLEPDRARVKLRSEQYVVDELIRRMPELLGKARHAAWDCKVPGGCSLKRPDLLYVFDDRYVQIEIDERGHCSYDCCEEDARLEIIAADVGLPGKVFRLNIDSPKCFGTKRLSNGEQVVQINDRTAFDALMDETCHSVDMYLSNTPPPPTVVRVNLPTSSRSHAGHVS
jgi:hypothetical protein